MRVVRGHLVEIAVDRHRPRGFLVSVLAASVIVAVLMLAQLARSFTTSGGGEVLGRTSDATLIGPPLPSGLPLIGQTPGPSTQTPSSSPAAGSSSSSPQATRVCEARLAQYAGPLNPLHVSLVAAYASTAADVAAADEKRHAAGFRSSWRDRPAGEFEAVCFFDADAFGADPSPLPGGPKRPAPVDRVEDIVRPDGVPVMYAAGHRAELSPAPIPSGSGN